MLGPWGSCRERGRDEGGSCECLPVMIELRLPQHEKQKIKKGPLQDLAGTVKRLKR